MSITVNVDIVAMSCLLLLQLINQTFFMTAKAILKTY